MNFKKITSACLALAMSLALITAVSCDSNDESDSTSIEQSTSLEDISKNENESVESETTDNVTTEKNPQGIGKSFFEYFDTVSYV